MDNNSNKERMAELHRIGQQTIMNVDTYEVSVMFRAMQEYMEKRGIKHEL